jgi:hypothetical protein
MKNSYILLFLFSLALNAQDKLIFKNGKIKKGFIVSIGQDVIFFKNNDTALNTKQIPKADLILLENYKGDVFIFSEAKKTEELKKSELPVLKRNALGLQPLAIMLGRATIVYERFTKDNKVGFVFPLSLTFDPIGSLYNSRIDTNANSVRRLSGVNFIGGMDVNFYIGRNERTKFFVGPRIRYGTDMFLRGIEAYSIQTQFGWKIGNPSKASIQHLSFGFGLVRILSSPAGALISPKQSYAWCSVNYRVGIKW